MKVMVGGFDVYPNNDNFDNPRRVDDYTMLAVVSEPVEVAFESGLFYQCMTATGLVWVRHTDLLLYTEKNFIDEE